jgi:hypothetical protein
MLQNNKTASGDISNPSGNALIDSWIDSALFETCWLNWVDQGIECVDS